MIKFLLIILFIILPIIILNYLMRGVYKVFGPSAQQRQRARQANGHSKKYGGIQIDHIPNKKGGKFGDNYKGGEYVDYEEVK